MTTAMHDQPSVRSPREGWASRILVREMWATVAIVAMWVAVLFVGVYGGEATFHSVDSTVTAVPSGVFVRPVRRYRHWLRRQARVRGQVGVAAKAA